jgi:hypothetical protein
MSEQARTASPVAASLPEEKSSAETSAKDDMLDTDEELDERWKALAEPLKQCKKVIVPAFQEADLAALAHQRRRRRLTELGAICGTVAVLFAIVQLAFPRLVEGHLLVVLEVLAVLAAAGAVAMGAVSLLLAKWLVERHKAERLRLAKFRFLIDPAVWSGDPAAASQRLQRLEEEVQRIVSLTARDMHEEIKKENPPEPPPEPGPAQAIAPQTLAELVAYYRAKRLLFQRDYFRDRIKRNEAKDWWTRMLPPILFFVSVLAVLIHFVLDLMGGHGPDQVSRICIVLAAALPAVAAGVREYRAAYEFGRNSSRYRAKEVALSRLDDILRDETDPWSKIRELWYSEEILEFEHREWCRLMMDTE